MVLYHLSSDTDLSGWQRKRGQNDGNVQTKRLCTQQLEYLSSVQLKEPDKHYSLQIHNSLVTWAANSLPQAMLLGWWHMI